MTEIVILDVGHGNCAVVYENERCAIIDAGPGTALLEFILENGITVVEEILISHADTDHLKGVQTLLDHDGIDVRCVRLNSDAAKDTKQWDGVLYSLQDRERNGTITFEVQLVEGLLIQFFDSDVEVLAPGRYLAGKGPGSQDSNGHRIATNTISAIVRVRTSDQSVLFTGDIDELGLQHVLEANQDLSADILVFPHHGGNVSASSTSQRNGRFAAQLLAAVSPRIVVFSFSRTQRHFPRPEIISVVKEDPSRKVMCTQMSQHCLSEAPMEAGHLTSVFANGRQLGHCCAGSIVVSGANLSPSVASHTEFVRTKAPNSLCT